MSEKKNAQNVIQSYRRRQQLGPFVIGGLAIFLVIVGILVLVIWLTGPNRPGVVATATATNIPETVTPSATTTNSPTPLPPTATRTNTPTITFTSTVTITSTPTGPFEYEVKEGDTCYTIAQTYKANIDVLVALNPQYGANCIINPGDKLLIPTPNQQMPSETPLPTGMVPGTIINYTVKSGDTVRGLAIRFFSTEAAIVLANKLANSNDIQVGQVLKIPINIVTPVPTATVTRTKALATPTVAASQTSTVTATKVP
jgi:LysM repeat protein